MRGPWTTLLADLATLPISPKLQQNAANHETDFELWLAGWTQQEIADAVGSKVQAVNESLSGFGNIAEIGKSIPNGNIAELNKTDQNAANHETDC